MSMRSWERSLPPELRAIQWRWWLPEGAAKPVCTERGPLMLSEKRTLAAYYAKREKPAENDTTMARFHGYSV